MKLAKAVLYTMTLSIRRVPLQQATVKAFRFLHQSCCEHATPVHLHAAFLSSDTSTRSE
jgi:hypothetical protein